MSDPDLAAVRAYLDHRHALGALGARVADIAAHDLRVLESWRSAFEAARVALPAAPAREVLAGLWTPRDPASLGGPTDAYEVIGRFAFEGVDGANLHAMAAALDALAGDLDAWRAFITGLATVPERAQAQAQAQEESELATGRAQQAELLKRFEPEAATLREICARLRDALRAAKRPDLTRADTAESLYEDYVQRVNALYTRALPVLRTALGELSRVAGVETPPNWPDALPFEPSLPLGLATPAPTDSPALVQARQAVEALTQREAELQRAIDELGVQGRRAEAEGNSLRQREKELEREALVATAIVRWAAKHDELDAARQRAAELTAQGQRETQSLAQVAAELQRLGAQGGQLQREATECAQALAAKEAALTAHRAEEPFFGKDEWRRKGEALERECEEQRAELTRRQQSLAALNAEVGRVRAREPLAQGAIAMLQKSLEEARGAEARATQELTAIESALGAERPPRRVTVAQAEELLQATNAARGEARQRAERFATEARRVREDLDRAAVQLRHATAERERAAASLQVAFRASTTEHEDRVRTLGARRQQAFENHAATVLGGLEESLTQVDRIFIDPARRALLVRAGMMSESPGKLRDLAAAMAAGLPELSRASGAALDDAARELARLRAWLASAPALARAAWKA